MKAAEDKEIVYIFRRESDRDVVGPQQLVYQGFVSSQMEMLRSEIMTELKAGFDGIKKCLNSSATPSQQPDAQSSVVTSPSTRATRAQPSAGNAPDENTKRKRAASRDAHMQPGQFIMKDESSILSVRELHEEYFIGMNGTPSLRSLEEGGSKWRRYKGMRQRWHERQLLIRGFERLEALHGGTEQGIATMQNMLDGIHKRGSSKSPNWAELRKRFKNSDEEKMYQESKKSRGDEHDTDPGADMIDDVYDENTEGGIIQVFPAWAVPMA